MHSEILEKIGLSPNEAKVYETLLLLGTSSIDGISLKSGVHRRNVYDTVEKLIGKGLATQEFVSGRKYIRAINPSRLLDIVRERESEISSILPSLQEKFNAKVSDEEAVIYRGIEGVKNYLQDILTENETAYFIGAKGFWKDPRLAYFLPKWDKQRIKQGIHFKHIFDYEVKSQVKEILKLRMNEFKFLPPDYSCNACIDFFGNQVTCFYGIGPGDLGENPVQFTVRSRKIADGYRKWFDFMWKQLGRATKVD